MKQLSAVIIILFLSTQVVFSQVCKDSITASTPNSRFRINGQEVTDNQTGLIWKKCSAEQSGSDCNIGNDQKYTFIEATQLAETVRQQTGVVWRLPNVKELLSISEVKCYGPAINAIIFPNTYFHNYWTASYEALYVPEGFTHAAERIWAVSFSFGSSSPESYRLRNYVRLVRTKQ